MTSPRPRVSLPAPQLVAGMVALVASVAIAVATAWPIYGSTQAIVAAAIATAVGAGSVMLGWALRWRLWQTGIVAVALYVLTVVPAAVPSAMTSPRDLLAGIGTGLADVVLGWKRLLTISVPAGDYQSVLVPYFFTLAVCTFAAAALMVHGGRWAPFAVAPLLTMSAFGAFFGTSTTGADLRIGPFTVPAPAHVAVASLALLVCLAWLLVRARIARSNALKAARSRTGTATLGSASGAFALRRQLVGVGMVVVTVAVALAAAPLSSAFGARVVARDAVDPLLMLQQQASPLSSYREWSRTDRFGEALFTVETTSAVDRLRIATLDAYDGVTFYVGATDQTAQLVRQPQRQGRDISVTIQEGFEGVWVPLSTASAGAPRFGGERAAELADSYYASADLGAGVIVAGQDPQSVEGLRAGDTYTLTAAASTDTAAFERAVGGEPLISEDAYPALTSWVEAQELDRTGASLIALVERLRERGYLSHATDDTAASNAWITALSARAPFTFYGSRAGHSSARVEQLFEDLVDQQDRAGEDATDAMLVAAVGDDEQFATAAALLARHLGFESRVVMGVRLGDTGSDWAVPSCADTCTGENVTAWAEARSVGGEWVTLDATPQFTVAPSLIEEGQNPPENPTEPEEVEAEVIDPPTTLSETTGEATQDTPVEEDVWLSTYMPLILAIASAAIGTVLVVLPFLVFPVAKASHRRWRRRAAVPEVAMVGAWEELMDRYTDAGIEIPRGLTRAEVADVLARPPAVAVAAIVDRAVFAEHPPSREASQGLWDIVDDERRALKRELSWWARLTSTFTPASFMRTLRAQRTDELSTLQRKDTHAVR
ncbi:transglutaminase-like domain-containing protein [Demequina sp.]|uniref:transglutaminase-like domain-containing protein n=1 Tax=Demequina sp. TaxID=2050685 RepID=UPI003A8827B1